MATETLTVAGIGTGAGTITSSPAGISCPGTCSTSVASGSMVTLTASPSTGSAFTGWSGGGCTGTGACTLTVSAATTVNATFTLNTFALTVAKAGTGAGTVTSSPAGISCGADCSEVYGYGQVVTLTASASPGSTFAGWSGACAGTGTCTLTISAATSVNATFMLDTFALTVAKAGTGAGTVTSSPAGISCGADCSEVYGYGQVVTLTATAALGSTFTGWSGGGCTGTGACTLTVSAATTVNATFTLDTFTLTVAKAGTGSGTVTSSPVGISCGADCSEVYGYGQVVALTASPSTGSTFAGWSGGGCSGTGSCLVTVNAAATITATFTLDTFTLSVSKAGTGTGTVSSTPAGISCGATCSAVYGYGEVVALTATASPGSTFTGWSGACAGTGTCNVTVTAARSVTATFTRDTFTLTVAKAGNGTGTVSSSPAGIACGADCAELYDSGTVVTLTASATTGSTFTGWSGGGCTGTGTCTVTVNAATTVTATFTLDTFTLTVAKAGTGEGTVTSTPAGISCGADCSEPYTWGQLVRLTATPSVGSAFTGWSGGGCTGTGTCLVSVSAATTVTATFALQNYTLTVNKTGNGSGTVFSFGAGISCGADCSEPYPYNTMVTLGAGANSGSTFTGWSGGGCSGTGNCTVTLSAATTVTANFTLNNYTVTVGRSGTGSGTVVSSFGGINCGSSCTGTYTYGQSVTLSAFPGAGAVFTGWAGDCTGTGDCVLNVTSDLNATAIFDLATYDLTVSRAGTGTGTVTSAPAGIDCGADCTEPYTHNTLVMLTAAAAPGSVFQGWSGGGCAGTGQCTVLMNAVTNVTATFVLDTYVLTVNKAGTGTGTVTSNPAGINCGADCSEPHASGTVVTLTAAPAVGSTFAGWSGGGCTGTGTCVVTVAAATTVTATFTLQSFALTSTKSGTGSGTVTSNPAGINCGADCSEPYTFGTVVTLTAAPAVGSTFAGWSGGGCTGTGTCTVTVSAATTVNAQFTLNSYTLTVSRAGAGTGTVTSAPAGINCGLDCTEPYTWGTSVTLTATASGSDVFNGWSGDCTGMGTCTVTISAAANVTATFAQPPNYMFVTSTTNNGALGGLAGADAICQARANAVGLAGTFRAYLSSSTVNAISRLGTASGWIRPDGQPVYNTQADLVAGRVQYLPWLSEAGVDLGPQYSVTGSSSAGVATGSQCSDWTSAIANPVAAGQNRYGNGQIFNQNTLTCATNMHLYCFGIDRQGAAMAPAVAARRAFLSMANFNPTTGLAGADAICASEGAALGGTWRALLATSTTTAASRFNTAGATWARADNVPLASSAANVMSATRWNTSLNMYANGGRPGFANLPVWTGATSPTVLGTLTSTCNNWSASSGSGTAGLADDGVVAGAIGAFANATACTISRPVYCLQE